MKFWRFLKSSPLAVTALVMGAVLAYLIIRISIPESPAEAFQRVVAKPIPASVRNIHASGSGGTHLAGGWDLVSFELSPEDFPKILVKEKFVEKRFEELVHPLRFPPLEDPIYFQASSHHGLITFTIKTNASRTVVHYRYDKI